MLYRKRTIDLLVSLFSLKRNLVTGKCWPGNRDSMVNFQPGSQLGGLTFFHVIAKLIFSVFHRRAEIPANRASPPRVIGPLDASRSLDILSVMIGCLLVHVIRASLSLLGVCHAIYSLSSI